MGRLLAIIRKEFIHIRRDPRTLVVMFLLPVVQLFLMGYAATTDIEHLRTVVLDTDRTSQSRALVEAYRASNYFNIVSYVEDEKALARLVDGGQVRAGLIIPADYGADVAAGRIADVAFVIDGSDPNVANTVYAASQQVGQAQSVRLIERQLGVSMKNMPGVEVHPRVWYNPEMKSANFMIPG